MDFRIKNNLIFLLERDDFYDRQLKAVKKKSRIHITRFSNADHLKQNLLLDPDAVIIDYDFEKQDPELVKALIQDINKEQPDLPIVVASDQVQLEGAMNTIKERAADFVVKNEFFLEKIQKTVVGLAKMKEIKREARILKRKLKKQRLRWGATVSVLMIAAIGFYMINH